jgi:hypothetical protein
LNFTRRCERSNSAKRGVLLFDEECSRIELFSGFATLMIDPALHNLFQNR